MIDVPVLDDIGFDALVEKGRGLIPRYAPEWTDHNLHDPGMTLLDLLAWFVDQQVYRIGFVGDAHVAAFAALFGVRPKAAVPARGLIWADPDALTFDQTLEASSRAHPIEQPGLAFSAVRDLHITAAKILSIESQDAVRTRRIEPEPTGAVPIDAGAERIEIRLDRPLASGAATAPVSLGLAYDEPLPVPGRAPVRISQAGADGRWRRTEAAWLSQSGAAAAAGALLFSAAPGADRLRLEFETGGPRRMVPKRIGLNAVPIVQIERLESLKIGEGTGWPDQEVAFELEEGGAVEPGPGLRELVISSTGRDGKSVLWSPVPDFRRSGPGDAAYTLDRERGIVRFGNGVNGRAPARGDEIFRGALDVTLGAKGNLAARAVWTMVGINTGGLPFGRNAEPVLGGSDAWSGEALLAELRRRVRRAEAMLSDEEMRAAATGLSGFAIEQAEVLPLFWPTLPGHAAPGARTLLLRARAGVAPSEAWLGAIERALAPRRVLGERLAVLAAAPVAVDVEGNLLIAAGTDGESVGREAEDRLRDRLALVRRREGQEIEPWPSGRPVTIAELETLLAPVPGLLAITDLKLAREGEAPARVSIPLARTEAAIAANVRLNLKVER